MVTGHRQSLAFALFSGLATAAAEPLPSIAWQPQTLTLVAPGGHYARLVRLPDGALLCAYSHGPGLVARRSEDDGRTWAEEVRAAGFASGVATNADVLALPDGHLLLAYNERPARDSGLPYTIMLCESADGGRHWQGHRRVFTAGTTRETGCWEPAMLRLPDGSLHLYFANEAPYPDSSEQETSLMTSADSGRTWTPARTVSCRKGCRDGMPVPLLLASRQRLVLAIEDNGDDDGRLRQMRPVIVGTPWPGAWERGAVGGSSPDRWEALAEPLPPDVYAGAPYLVQMSSGETVLSVQSREGGRREPAMVVYVGSAEARGFTHPSRPVEVPAEAAVLWNALFAKSADTVTAVMGTRLHGTDGVWTIDGRLVRH